MCVCVCVLIQYTQILDFLLAFLLSFRPLKEAFLHQLMNGSRPSDLQLRNDLLVITTLIAESPSCLLIVSTGPETDDHIHNLTEPQLSAHREYGTRDL